MKKIVLLSFLVVASVMCFGQSAFRSETTGKLIDTVTTVAKFQKSIQGAPKAVTAVQVTITKISGTVAGTVRLYGSLDGVTFVRVAPTDSLNASNVATQGKIFILNSPVYSHLRVGYTPTGTMSASFKAIPVSAPLR